MRPSATSAWNCASVGAGSVPLKPPTAITGAPRGQLVAGGVVGAHRGGHPGVGRRRRSAGRSARRGVVSEQPPPGRPASRDPGGPPKPADRGPPTGWPPRCAGWPRWPASTAAGPASAATTATGAQRRRGRRGDQRPTTVSSRHRRQRRPTSDGPPQPWQPVGIALQQNETEHRGDEHDRRQRVAARRSVRRSQSRTAPMPRPPPPRAPAPPCSRGARCRSCS